jgi:uncharacterized protein YndB with AHSA1/START domain
MEGFSTSLAEKMETIVEEIKTENKAMKSICPPDISSRPLRMTWKCFLNASPEKVYEAWTSKFDLWFAQPGAMLMTPEVDRPYFFYNKNEWGRHPHYGRFLELIENEVVEMTWVTGNGSEVGTEGAETVIRVELVPKDLGTSVHFTHSGFVTERSRDDHKENWPLAFKDLEKAIEN